MIKHLDGAYLTLEKKVTNYGHGSKGTRVCYDNKVGIQKHRPGKKRYVKNYRHVSEASARRVERLIHKMDWI